MGTPFRRVHRPFEGVINFYDAVSTCDQQQSCNCSMIADTAAYAEKTNGVHVRSERVKSKMWVDSTKETEMDFIEHIFGIFPDGGSGSLEFLLFSIPIVGICYLVLRRRGQNQKRD